MIKIDVKEDSPIDKDKLKIGDIYEYEGAFHIIIQIGNAIYMINLETGQPTFLVGQLFLKAIKSATLRIERN